MKKMVVVLACLALATSFADGQTKAQPHSVQSATRLLSKPARVAAPPNCPIDPVLASDGVVTSEDLIFSNSSAYYKINAKGGRSYSFEVWDPFDPPMASPLINVTTDCSNKISTTDVTHVDPNLSGGFSARVSWIQTSDQTLYIQVQNPDAVNSYTYYIRFTDTTLFNPRWDTMNASKTHWAISNTTGAVLSGTFTAYDLAGNALLTINNMSIPAGGTTLLDSQSIGLANDGSGSATFACVGPAGAAVADAYIEEYWHASLVIVPTVFVGKHAFK